MNRRTIAAGAILSVALSSATALATADAAQTSRGSAYDVTAKVNKTELLVDGKVKIKATVKPAAPGAKVVLQLKYDDQKKWKTVDTGRLTGRSKVTFKDKVSSVRARKYRVVKPGDSRHAAGSGETPKVTVFGWRNLTSLNPAVSASFSEMSSISMNGVSYPDSLRSYVGYPPPGNTGSIDYNLNRGCRSFRAVVGADDTSPAAGTVQISVSTDATPRYSGSFALTQTAPVTLDVTNVFRITISETSTGGGLAGIGTPQVLCSF